MTTIKLNEHEKEALSFEGNVLEFFNFEGSQRFHVTLIAKLELTTDKKGKHNLNINTVGGSGLAGINVDENAFAKATQLVAEIERAKTTFQFD